MKPYHISAIVNHVLYIVDRGAVAADAARMVRDLHGRYPNCRYLYRAENGVHFGELCHSGGALIEVLPPNASIHTMPHARKENHDTEGRESVSQNLETSRSIRKESARANQPDKSAASAHRRDTGRPRKLRPATKA